MESLRESPAVRAATTMLRREPLHVPLERRRQRLVEVVQVEDEVALGGGEDPEVREVAVAAGLDLDPAPRRRAEVGGHHGGGSA